jgi:hypothetical protein
MSSFWLSQVGQGASEMIFGMLGESQGLEGCRQVL